MGAASVVRFTITGVRDSVRGGGVQIVPQREERERERLCGGACGGGAQITAARVWHLASQIFAAPAWNVLADHLRNRRWWFPVLLSSSKSLGTTCGGFAVPFFLFFGCYSDEERNNDPMIIGYILFILMKG